MTRRIWNGMAGGLFAASLVCSTAALAQQGSTSGPAAGSTVEPSTATQKKKMMSKGDQAGSDEMKSGQAGTGAGAPGVAAKPGTESGAAPQKSDQ